MAGTAPLLSSKEITVTWGENTIEFLGTFSGLPATQENTSYEVETNERSFVKNTPNKKYSDYDIEVFFDNTVRDGLIKDKEAGTSKVLKFASTVSSATWTKSYNAQVVTRDTVEVPISELACYVFEIMDEYGDGGATYSVFDGSNNRIIYGSGGTYKDYKGIDIQVTTLVALQEAEGAIIQTLAYPNPANDKLNLEISMAQSSTANISVVDMLGREVIRLGDVNLSTGNNLIEINTS